MASAVIGRLAANKQLALAAGAVASGIFVVYSLMSYARTSSKDLLPALNEEETLDIMEKMLNQMKLQANNMLNAHANIKQQIAAQGQQMSDKDIMVNYILPHFDSLLTELQSNVLDQCDVELCEIEEAVDYYEPKVLELAEVVFKMKTIYHEMGGDVDLDYAEQRAGEELDANAREITSKELMGFLRSLSAKMSEQLGGYADAFIGQYGIPRTQEHKQAFQIGMMTLSEDAQKETLAEFKMSETELQRSLMENQTNEELQMIFISMQVDSTQILASKGISLA